MNDYIVQVHCAQACAGEYFATWKFGIEAVRCGQRDGVLPHEKKALSRLAQRSVAVPDPLREAVIYGRRSASSVCAGRTRKGRCCLQHDVRHVARLHLGFVSHIPIILEP